jgi:hypothetical protein
MAISINILIYFMLTKLDRIYCWYFIRPWNQKVFENENGVWCSQRLYWSKLRTSRYDCTSYGEPTVLTGHFNSNMMGSWHKWPQPLPSHTLHI